MTLIFDGRIIDPKYKTNRARGSRGEHILSNGEGGNIRISICPVCKHDVFSNEPHHRTHARRNYHKVCWDGLFI